ncbi:MAG: AI-2E family transporter [Planctomycetes bacterium]|nr:AI-2E family transporter [Planctomycetota bacterium]
MTTTDRDAKSSWIVGMASLVMVVAVLYLAKGVLIPLMLALVLTFLLGPVCNWLEKLGFGRISSVLITVIVAFTLLGAGVWIAAVQVMDLAPKLPEYQNNVQTKLHSVNDYLGDALRKVRGSAQSVVESDPATSPAGVPANADERPLSVRVIPSPQSPLEVISGIFGPLLFVLGSCGVVLILVVFCLIRREDLRDRFIRLVGRGSLTVTTRVLEDAASRVSRYLLMLLIINVSFGVPIAIGLHFIGVPNAMLWGLLATVLRFVPYIGPWIAAAGPVALSLAISTGWAEPIMTIGLFVLMELLSNNVIEPWLYGKHTGISPVALLVAAVFWTWLWGPVGLLLATPLTVCLLVIGKHVPQLSFLDTLLGTEPVFELKTRVYQRLLAGDQEEATELLLEELGKRPIVEVYDTVVVPALALSETHWHRGEIDDSRHDYILQGIKTSIEELGDRVQATLAESEGADAKVADGSAAVEPSVQRPTSRVVCLPAHDEADEIAALMLAQLVETPECSTSVLTAASSLSELYKHLDERKPDVVCISATPPAAVMHSRRLYRHIRGRFPNAKLVVGLWDAAGNLNHARERIGCGADAHLVSTLAAAEQRVLELIRPPFSGPETPTSPGSGPAVVPAATG